MPISREHAFIDLLRGIAHDPAARDLVDDCAVVPMGTRDLVVTHDMIVEGVHYLPDDPPADIAWKLVAVNLSDLAAKGATPLGLMLGYPLAPDAPWDRAFVEGLRAACETFGAPLLGGDTVSLPAGNARQLGLTAFGTVAAGSAPSRAGAQAGDILYVTGTIGGAGRGLAVARREITDRHGWLNAYRRPCPRTREGIVLAPHVHAMMDVSDGLLIDLARLARASGLAARVDLDAVPLADGICDDRTSRLQAATAGDDYELLLAAPTAPAIEADGAPIRITRVGELVAGSGVAIHDRHGNVPLPTRLGYEHGSAGDMSAHSL